MLAFVLFADRLWGGVEMFPAEDVLGQINVEIDGLKSVAAAMRAELQSGFRSQVKPVHDAMQPGASVGGQIAGAEWAYLQTTYTANIQGTLDALFNLDKGTQAVAHAADVIAKTYGDADAFSRARVDDVHDVIAYTPPPPQQLGPYPPAATDVRDE